MSVLVVGASHRSAPVELLERLALDAGDADKLRSAVLESAHVTEAIVLATCNRVEIYAEVERFHGGVEDLTALLVAKAGAEPETVIPALYVHYDEGAVSHLFSVATGLESMVVGEGQILGQVREALRASQTDEAVGTSLNSLFQQGLRVGKRAHAETGIDRAGQSIVTVALDEARGVVGDLADSRICIVGAGSIAALAAASVRRAGAREIVVSSLTRSNAQRVAHSVEGRAADLAGLADEIASADVLISCTGATGVVIPADDIERALVGRKSDRPLAIIDLALPHDVAPEVADHPRVTLIALKTLAETVHTSETQEDVEAVQAIVAEEVVAFATARDAARVAPTVVALRSMATAVVAAELERLWGRLDDLTPDQRVEIARTMRRVADKLLHEPTVRIKELAGRYPEASYAEALAELFALDPAAVDAVIKPGDPT